MNLHTLVAALTLALLTTVAGAVPATAQDPLPEGADTAYTPGAYRVFTGTGEPASLDSVVGAMEAVDVVFIGETHDDPTGHMLEAELLERAREAYGDIALSLEFFERDVQLVVDEYLDGLITESSFRAASRLWDRYETDYRGLIEFSKAHGVDVIAANAPRRYVNRVTMHGRDGLRDLSAAALEYLPPLPYGQPSPEYRDQWIGVRAEIMEQEGTRCGIPVDDSVAVAPRGAHAGMGNQLDAQTLWDAAMAWSITEYLDAGDPDADALVLHMVGGFHVARGTGTPEHLAAYRPDADYMVVMLRPVDDVDAFEPAPEGRWGDFVIQTDASRTLEAIECRAFLEDHRPDDGPDVR